MMDRLFKHVDGNCIVSFVVRLGLYGIEVRGIELFFSFLFEED